MIVGDMQNDYVDAALKGCRGSLTTSTMYRRTHCLRGYFHDAEWIVRLIQGLRSRQTKCVRIVGNAIAGANEADRGTTGARFN